MENGLQWKEPEEGHQSEGWADETVEALGGRGSCRSEELNGSVS